jgi:crotonobetainyl-CoA:carnitine CoA-transferase CaiB-like acyl-CoA transferase
MSIVDFMTGYAMGLALVSGIMKARSSGTGQDIDVSLYDVGVANLNYLASWAMNAGYEPTRQPRSAHPSLTPCQLYRTLDGWLFIMANKEKFWPILCDKIGRPLLATDPRFVRFVDRLKHREELTGLLDDALSAKTTQTWIDILSGAVPCAPVNTVTTALQSDFMAESGMAQPLGPGAWQNRRVMGNPIKTSEPAVGTSPPTLGQDTDALLAECGFGADEIERLRNSGAIG